MLRPSLLVALAAGIAILAVTVNASETPSGARTRYGFNRGQDLNRRLLEDDDEVEDEPYRGYRGGDEHDMPHSSEHPGGYPVEHREPDAPHSAYGGRQVINLEMVKRAGEGHAPTRAPANITVNDTKLIYGVICRRKPYAAGYTASAANSYDEEDDLGPLIKGEPHPMKEIGKGTATIRLLPDATTVDIDNQRGMMVGRMRGSIKTYFGVYDDTTPCHSLLTDNTHIDFTDVPVYAMITRARVPLDSSMLKPLLPVLSGPAPPVPSPPSPPIDPPIVPPVPLGLTGPLLAAAQAFPTVTSASTSDAAFDLGPYAARSSSGKAKVSAADAYYAEDEYDTTLCGLTLVAKGPVKLKTLSANGASKAHYRGSIEATLLWTNGIITLPGFVAEALAAANGQPAQSIFSTSVNQVLTSTVTNGRATASIQPFVGNSATSTGFSDGTASATGGNVNITQNNNTAEASANNATLIAGDTNTGNTISVVNDLGSVLEQYLKLLKTVCHHHKDLPLARPGNLRLDVAQHEAGSERVETQGT